MKSDTALITGAFALGGVIVGGLLNGIVGWIQERGKVTADARVAALLVTEELIRSSAALLALRNTQQWGVLQGSPWFGNRVQWDTHRGVLGRRLKIDAWTTLSSTYGNLERIAGGLDLKVADEVIPQDEGREIARSYFLLNLGLTYLGALTYRPKRWRPIKRWHFNRKNAEHAAALEADEKKLRISMDQL